MGKPQQSSTEVAEQELGDRERDSETGYDASNPTHVGERRTKSKVVEDQRAEGLRFVMSTRQGRVWMRHLLTEKLFTGVGRQPPARVFTGNSTTFYNVALKEVGDALRAELATMAQREFRLMEDEGDSK